MKTQKDPGSLDSGAFTCSSAWIPPGKRYSSSFLQGLGGWDAIPFLRSYRGTHPLGCSALSLLRCGEHPRGYPDVASGGYSYPALRLGASRGGAVSSVVTSGCPKRSEGGFPVGTRTNAAPHRPFQAFTSRGVLVLVRNLHSHAVKADGVAGV